MGTVNILGRVSNLNHKPIQTFEDTVKVEAPSELLARKRRTISRFTGRLSRCVPDFTRSIL